MGSGAVRGREEIHAALDVRATQKLALLAPRGRADLVGLQIFVRVVLDGLAGLGVDPVRPIHLCGILLGLDELAVAAVKGIEKPVAAEMREYLPVFAIYFGVDQLAYADLIVVKEVARRVLEVPLDLAAIDVQGKGRVGEQVVTRTV